MILETVRIGAFQVNCYILSAGKKKAAVIIDPGDEENKIRRLLDKHGLAAGLIVNTHGHIDHIGCDDKFAVPVYAYCDEVSLLKSHELNLSSFLESPYIVKSTIKALQDKEKIFLDEIELEVIHTPGHTPGGICLLMKKPSGNILFSGDTLFRESVGRTDFQGADPDVLIKSIRERLLVLADDVVIYPGHGPASTIGYERKHNPFLGACGF